MGYYLLKLCISAAIIVIVSEVSKYHAVIGGLIKSLPLISIIALVWLYIDTHDTVKIAALSTSTFWFVLPTLPMFLILPILLGKGLGFYMSLGISIAIMLIFYMATLVVLKWFGVQL